MQYTTALSQETLKIVVMQCLLMMWWWPCSQYISNPSLVMSLDIAYVAYNQLQWLHLWTGDVSKSGIISLHRNVFNYAKHLMELVEFSELTCLVPNQWNESMIVVKWVITKTMPWIVSIPEEFTKRVLFFMYINPMTLFPTSTKSLRLS